MADEAQAADTTAKKPVAQPSAAPPAMDTPAVVEQESPPVPQTQAEKIDAAIHGWLHARIANSVIAQHTPAWNHLTANLAELRDAIIQGI